MTSDPSRPAAPWAGERRHWAVHGVGWGRPAPTPGASTAAAVAAARSAADAAGPHGRAGAAWAERGAPRRRSSRWRPAQADPESVARKILLDALTGQARSRKELADKLAQEGGARGVADPAARPVHRGRPDRRRSVRPGVDREPAAAARGWHRAPWPRSCGARASTTRRRDGARARSTTEDQAAAARALVRQEAAHPCAALDRADGDPAAGRACWPARATPPAWRSRSCARRWASGGRRRAAARCRLRKRDLAPCTERLDRINA